MTRFARAKGSKASNERTPEDSTPWEVMKEQLLQSKKEKEEAGKRKEAENQRIENYENFLKEHKVSKRKATWCDFPEEQPKKRLLPQKQHPENKSNNQSAAQVPSSVVDSNVVSQADTANKSKKKKKNKNVAVAASSPDVPVQTSTTVVAGEESQPKKKKNVAVAVSSPDVPVQNNTTIDAGEESLPKKKKKNKNMKKANINGSTQQPDGNDVPMGASGEKIPQSDKKQKKKSKKKQQLNSSDNNPQDKALATNMVKSNAPIQNQQNGNSKGGPDANTAKKKKPRNGKPVRRKEINDNSFQLIINGKEVELVRFEGFPIMKKDAERLSELKKSMMQKGIPKSEVQRTMKLERRRAEKALARVKRDVCYNCRKGGHNLSDCPELKSKIPGVQAADGVCFKCGSTEHRQFECKVQRDKEFRFATCFICRESGHIARQCPDNPKGLYPNGGSCKLCGDVTHLRKDCPTTQGQREDTSVKLDTLQNADNIEDIGQGPISNTNNADSAKKQPKKIRF